jgi:magnesium-transporting ATPase (P-type)
VIGLISLVLLALSIVALYGKRLAGGWRWVYVSTAIAALYLNAFVGVVQAFQKIPSLNALAPTGSEPPFAVAQGVVLVAFIAFGVFAVRRFHPGVLTPAHA